MRTATATWVCAAALAAGAARGARADELKLTRASLAPSARFVVTYTLSPKNGSKDVRTFRVEVSGNRARLEYEDAALGKVRYLVNEKGAFFYIPASKAAQKMEMKGGIDQALGLAYAQVATQMRGAKKSGTATISGQPTDIYKNARTGTVIYVGKSPGFRLPVKMETQNEGGRSTLLATEIRLNAAIPAARFALPPGTQVIDSKGAPGSLPGIK